MWKRSLDGARYTISRTARTRDLYIRTYIYIIGYYYVSCERFVFARVVFQNKITRKKREPLRRPVFYAANSPVFVRRIIIRVYARTSQTAVPSVSIERARSKISYEFPSLSVCGRARVSVHTNGPLSVVYAASRPAVEFQAVSLRSPVAGRSLPSKDV